MSQQWWEDDDQLSQCPRRGAPVRAQRARGIHRDRPGRLFLQGGIEAELAILTYDSIFEGAEAEFLAGVRS